MKLAFSTLGCPKLDFDETLAIAKDMGYDGVEIRGVGKVMDAPDIAQFAPQNIAATKARLKGLGLAVPIFTSACYLHLRENWDQTLALAKRYADVAAAMDVPYIRVLGDRDPQPDGMVDDELVRTRLAEVADYAAPLGVTVLLETNGDLANSVRLARLLENTARKNVGVIWDIHHPYRFFNESPEYTYSLIGEYVRHVHIKDSEKAGEGFHYEMPGYGDVPLKKAVETLLAHGYDGYFSLEWVKRWDKTLEEPGIVFANYVNYMKRWI